MNEKNKLIYIILVIVILIMVAINLQVFINNYFENDKVSKANDVNVNTTVNQPINTDYNMVSEEEEEQNRDKKVATLNERQRMQTYFGRYISYIESKDYQSAYDLLYDGFKKNYFPTIEEFITYAQNNYPSNIVVEYLDIEREGTLYILKVKIRDSLKDTSETEVEEEQVVVTENAINDFYISFEVNE